MKRVRHPSGLSLVEALASLAILALGVTGAVQATVASSRTVALAGKVGQGTMLAENLLATLLAAPWTAHGTGNSAVPRTLFSNVTTANDADLTDTQGQFRLATVPTDARDHDDTELVGSPLGAALLPLPSDTVFERYWSVAPAPVGAGVVVAVVVRWREGDGWQRTVLVGTRYQP